MTIYTYCYQEQNIKASDEIEKYLQLNNLTGKKVLEDADSVRVHWHKRAIGHLLEGRVAQPGDSIVVYEAADLARSTCQMLEILVSATAHQINIHFVKYNETFHAKEKNKLADMLRLVHHIENDFISRRTTDALARRRAAGLPLGRPKGRKNKALKLDKYKKDIVKYLDLAISKTSIAKLVDCHPQTLYDWIDRNMISDRKARKARKPRQQTVYASVASSNSELV